MKVLLLGLATAVLLATGCPVTRQCSAEADCDGVLYRCREGQCLPPWVSLPDPADAGTSSSSSSSSGSSGNCTDHPWDLVRGDGGVLDVLWVMDESNRAGGWNGSFADHEDDLTRPLTASGVSWQVHLVTASILAPSGTYEAGECRRQADADHLLFSGLSTSTDDHQAGLYAARLALTPSSAPVTHPWGPDGGASGREDFCGFTAGGPQVLVIVADTDEGSGLENQAGLDSTVAALRAQRPDLRVLVVVPADGYAQADGGCVSSGTLYPLYDSAVSQLGNASQRLNLCDFHPGTAGAFNSLAANILRSCVRVFPGTVGHVTGGAGQVNDFETHAVDGGTRVVLGAAVCSVESQVTVQTCP